MTERDDKTSAERMFLIRESIIEFLCGSAPHPLTGQWFGEGEDSGRGRYWWRTTLRAEAEPQDHIATAGNIADRLAGSGKGIEALERELLEEAYTLFSDDPETDETGTDAWAWKEKTRWHLKGLCPRPFDGDDGSQKACIEKGHCGCVYSTLARSAARLTTEPGHTPNGTDLIGLADRIKKCRGDQDAAAFGFHVFLYRHESIDVENALRSTSISATERTPIVLPDGWSVERVEDRVILGHPRKGFYAAKDNPDNVAETVLAFFAEDCLHHLDGSAVDTKKGSL